MKVGLNLVYLVEDSGGSGTYARHLTASLLEVDPKVELTAWIGSSAPESLLREPWAERVRWVRLPVVGIGSPWHLWHELLAIGFDARRRGIEVVHGLANINPVVHPGVATVTTILDVIWAHHPEAATLRFRAMGKLVTPVVGRASDRIIAISQAAGDDVAQTLGLDRAKFDVTPLGIEAPPPRPPVDPAAVAARLGLSADPVVLCVAAKRSHKNLHGLIRAWALLPAPRPQLVLPGSPNAYEAELRELAAELGVQDSVRFLGWLSREDVEDLYAIARCFVLATFLEGFGLPVLEAMARGVPVACSDIAVLREVAGDAALLFDPDSPQSIAATLQRMLADEPLRNALVERGRERCRMFTWRRTAEETLASYRRAVGGAKSG